MRARMNSPLKTALVALSAALLLSACNGSDDAKKYRHNREGTGTAVATWDSDSITQEELKQRFLEMSPFARTRYQTVEARKEYVEGLARFELLAAEAAKRGLQNDPEVIETAKKVMVQKLLQKEFDEKAGKKIEDADVTAYYESHKADYVKPEMIRLSDIFIASAKDAPDREQKKQQALSLQQQAAALPPMDFQAFGKLVRENSEDPRTKPLDGDMRYLSKDELTQQYSPEVAAAAEQLKEVGALSPIVETDKGFYILKLQGRQNALDLKPEQVKTQIQQRILYERRTQDFNAFVDKLKKEQDFKINNEALGKFEIDLKAPSQQPKGPPPGFIPAPNAVQ